MIQGILPPGSVANMGDSSRGPPSLPALTGTLVEEDDGDLASRRQARTSQVKVVISPIMQRMKGSLAKIQALEKSLNRSTYLEMVQEEHPSSYTANGSVPTPHSVGGSSRSSTGIHRQSRRLLKSSMRMLKSKLYTLHQMEEQLRVSEDRHQQLIHHVLQASHSASSSELISTQGPNHQLQDRVDELEEEKHQLERACRGIGPLESKLKELRMELKDMHNLKRELEETKRQCSLLEKDLAQRQSKINQQAVKCDDLECQMDQLKSMCDDLINDLERKKEQNELLEFELTQERKQRREQEQKFRRSNRIMKKRVSSSGGSNGPEGDSSSLDTSSSSSSEKDNENVDACQQQDQEGQQPRGTSMPSLRLQQLASLTKGRQQRREQQNRDHENAIKHMQTPCLDSTEAESDSSSSESSSTERANGSLEQQQDRDAQEQAKSPTRPLLRLQQLASSVFTKMPDPRIPSSPVKTVDTSQCSSSSTTSEYSSSSDPLGRPPKDVDTSRVTIYDDDGSTTIPADLDTVERLVHRIESMDRENAELIESQEAMAEQFHSLLQRNSRQAARIAELERQLLEQQQQQQQQQGEVKDGSHAAEQERKGHQCQREVGEQHHAQETQKESSPPKQQEVGEREPELVVEEPKKAASPSFFRKLLQSDARQLKQLLEGGGGGGSTKAPQKRQEGASEGIANNKAGTSSPPSQDDLIRTAMERQENKKAQQTPLDITDWSEAANVEDSDNVLPALYNQQHIPFDHLSAVVE